MKITIDIDIDETKPGDADLLRRLADAIDGGKPAPVEVPPIRVEPHTPPLDWPATGKPWIDPTKMPFRPYVWLGTPTEASGALWVDDL